MALWGKLDTLAASPKYITRKAYFGTAAVNSWDDDTIDLRQSNTDFAKGDGVVYNSNGGSAISGLTSGNTYYVVTTSVSGVIQLSDTEAHAKAGTNIITLSGTGNDAQFLQRNAEGNESTAPGNGDHTYNGMDLYFVDADEAKQPANRARGLKNPGWWLYRAWTNADGSLAQHSECLVALGGQSDKLQATTGDLGTGLRNGATDDSIVLDSTPTITVQPVNASVTAPATASFSVTATKIGAGTLTYQWQIQQSNESGTTWNNVSSGSGGTTATYTTAATAVTAGSGPTNGDKFRVLVGTSTANTNAVSDVVTLTVTA